MAPEAAYAGLAARVIPPRCGDSRATHPDTYRAEVIQHQAPHILYMQKALLLLNLHLSVVLSDITGVTGHAIIRAIVAGERDVARLAALRNPACKARVAEITKALTSTWQAEHLFVLQQALSRFNHSTIRNGSPPAMAKSSACSPRWSRGASKLPRCLICP